MTKSEPNTSFVSLKGIDKYYGKTAVIHNINLDVWQGEFLVLVGPSGCGKSTTLRIIAGLEEISHGELFINGQLMNDVAPKDRDIAMVFQNYALYPHMTVYKNMAFGLKLRKYTTAEIDRRVSEAAAILEIDDYLDRRPKDLSGGERQRVALGRAIVRKPNVFLFDEPLSNLDAKLRIQMRAEIKKLHKRLQTTMIYVTHDQVEAMTMGDRVVVMEAGYIRQIGSPLTIYKKPERQFVAGFIGSPPMNFFEAIIDSSPDLRINADSFFISLPDSLQKNLLQLQGREVSVGIRPEDFIIVDKPGEISAIVEVVELMGSDTNLHLRAGDWTFVVRTTSDRNHSIGDEVNLQVKPDKLHLFSAENGERLID